ncbi:GNAT family N-acetyltransferase [uncultured Cohaesibacter sp.]|uniref:GNAT family N-acetyltransferase n=1 Tax=uncultured Cohaesibacter sp. TaxID=1002546 RepID=UPI0029C83451|nr:GNAT family N-acetyltransferase [uncultured Cohaesibacter sp.]
MKPNIETRIETKRLLLRRPHREDADRIASMLNDFEISKYLTPVPHPYTLADAKAWLRRPIASKAPLLVFVIEDATHGVVGNISLEEELGYWIGRPYWGNGYCSEAVRALLDFHFSKTEAMIRSGVHIDNPRSMAIQRKFGFETIGREREYSCARAEKVERFVTRLCKESYLAALNV